MVKLVYSDDGPECGSRDQEAMAWVVRLVSGDSTPSEHELFRRWRDSSAENRDALARARTAWQQLGRALPAIESDQRRRRRRIQASRLLPIAASLLLSLGIGQAYWSTWRFDHVTAHGERRNFALPDGSRLTMSGDTAVDIDFSNGARRIRIARGEAVFSVRHDRHSPFLVTAGDASYRDVGTVFSVARHGDASRLVVSTGIVEASGGARTVRVVGGQAVAVAAGRLGNVGRVDPHAELAWTRGRLIFGDRSLRDIVAALAPHYDRRIVLLDKASGDERLSASIELGHINEWLDALKATRGVRITRFAGYTFIS